MRQVTHHCAARLGRAHHAWIALAALAPAFAGAAPQGEQVVSGNATSVRDGALTVITTTTPQTIVNYTSFDIGLGEAVRIDQPDAASRFLSNVLSTDPTRINGVLTSNGEVWIANPVGVFFGDHAVIDVGRLVAGAGKVDAAEFLAGVDHWSELTGQVEVGAGAQIRAAESVLLVGAAVANYGNVSAADGMIALVAGGEVRLARADGRVFVTADRAIAPDPARWGVVQAGTLDAGKGGVSLTAGDAYSLAINHTGITRASDIAIAGGEGGVVSVSGSLDASDRSAGATGGSIAVTGDRVALLGAQLDASGDAGGGQIRVGGDLRGQGDLPTAQRTYVDGSSALRADAIATGDGGTIIVWSDEATRFYGRVSARGGAAGGDGGFAEISGASLVSRGSVDLGAPAGRAGTLLYDPQDIQIVGGTVPPTDGSDAPDAAGDQVVGSAPGSVLFGDATTEPFQIYESEIEGTDANIVLEATNSIFTSDSSAFLEPVALKPDRSLTMLTRNDANDATGATHATAGIDLAGVSFQTAGTGAIHLETGTGTDTGVKADVKVANLTTAGGAVAVMTQDGDITVGQVTTTSGATGANGGDVTLHSTRTGSVTAGAIHASGADSGVGGDGGDVAVIANAGSVTVQGIDTHGGEGTDGGDGGAIKLIADLDDANVVPTGTFTRTLTVNGDLDAHGGKATDADMIGGKIGGKGGAIGLSAGLLAQSGSIVVSPTATLDASGGDGPTGGDAAHPDSGDAIRIEAYGPVSVDADLTANGGTSTSGGVDGNGGLISIASAAGNATYTGALSAVSGNGTDGTAVIEGHGAVAATIDAATVGHLEVVETDVTGTVDVSGAGGIDAHGAGAAGSPVHTINSIATTVAAPHFTYRLADTGGSTPAQTGVTTLKVANATFGPQGGAIANAHADPDPDHAGEQELLGAIEGSGGSPDVTTAGDLQLLALDIGTPGTPDTRLKVHGADGSQNLEMTVAGDAHLDVDLLAAVDVEQRDTGGDVDILHSGAGFVDIVGTVTDTGAGLEETSQVNSIHTAGTDFFFHLNDTTSDVEPLLKVQAGAVQLAAGDQLGLDNRGDVQLESGAIDGGGGTVRLQAGTNTEDTNGAIIGSGSGVDVAHVGKLVLLAQEGVGNDAAVRISASGAQLSLAGDTETGDFRVVSDGTAAIALDKITATSGIEAGEPVTATARGITAKTGAVDIDNAGGAISFGDIALTEDTAVQPHVSSGGSQRYGGSVALAADAALVAGGDVAFDGNVASSGGTAHDLRVTAGGTTKFAGDVGTGTNGALDQLVVGNAQFTGGGADGTNTVIAANSDFGAIDGAGSQLVLTGSGANSRIEIRDDVGGSGALGSFDADADLIVFGTRAPNGAIVTSADRIAAGSVALNDRLPVSTGTTAATIADTNGGLTIESAGDVAIGAGEKLSVAGPLAIRAGGTARLADLAATDLRVDASQIVIRGRAPGSVELPNGAAVPDSGVDWVANNIVTNVVPGWDGQGTAPTFALGDGGLQTSGAIPFDVVRFAPNGEAVRPANFTGPGGTTLDLTGLGGRAISDASNDVPRAAPPVLPGLAARAGDEPPTPPREVSGEELVGALHCRTASGDPCAPPSVGDDPLATERAIDIRQRYRALLESEEGVQSLRAAFAPVGSVPSGDPDALSRALAHDPALGDARARIGELAVALAQVEMLGLSASESGLARRAIAGDFAAATGIAGLGPDAVLAAVAASGVAVLP
jgi:filamentous hemagglutinin family protein